MTGRAAVGGFQANVLRRIFPFVTRRAGEAARLPPVEPEWLTIQIMPVTLLVQQVSLEDDALPHRRLKSLRGETGPVQWKDCREAVNGHIAFCSTQSPRNIPSP